MNKKILLLVHLAVLLTSASFAQANLINKSTLDNIIEEKMIETQSVFEWSSLDNSQLWSALIHSDSIAAIGYKTLNIKSLRTKIHLQDLESEEWSAARNKLIDHVVKRTSEIQQKEIVSKDIMPYGYNKKLPYFLIKISDLEIIKELKTFDELRYLEVPGYSFRDEILRSGEGCGNYSETLDAADYTNITPQAVQPWSHFEHQVDCAWENSNHGEGIWIAVMDTGVSEDNPKFNDEFDEGDSAGRSIEKYGFYQNDGWADGCGHGSAMAGLALAPRGFGDYPAGVAYRSNLISYRVTNDVRINSTDEINGLGNALVDAGDDERIHIISISLGDAFSSGPVEDGILYAHNQGKLIFAAAGTSTTITNWYGVIFPASMPETVAVTGVKEGSNFSACDICHTGSEVEFVVYMERDASNNNVPTITVDNTNGEYYGYVGGSSAATASMSGIAALVWGNNPDFDKNQLINRLIQTASNYPNKDSEYGWGAVDACQAVDSTFFIPCSSSISNEISMEITSITFPATSDTGGEAEWVLQFEGDSYYFNVPVDGATGNPASFIDLAICGSTIPLTVDLGISICGDLSVAMDMQSYEDDSFTSNCTYNTGINSDDDLTNETINVELGLNSFTHSSSAGDFIIEYILYCNPTLVAGISDDTPTCHGDPINFIASPSGESNYEFYHDINLNDQLDMGESLQSGLAENYTSTSFSNGDVIGLVVSDANGCTSQSLTTLYISAENYAGANKLVGTETAEIQYETDGVIESCQIIANPAVVVYNSATEISLETGFETINGVDVHIYIEGCDVSNNLQEETNLKDH